MGYTSMLAPVVESDAAIYARAREILGEDFISPREMNFRGVNYTHEQLAELREALPTDEVLEGARNNNYVVVPGPENALSLVDIHKRNLSLFYSTGGKKDEWFLKGDQEFAREETVNCGWIIMRKSVLPGSLRKDGRTRKDDFLGNDMRLPTAAELAWVLTTYERVRGTRLFPSVYVWTSSYAAEGPRVSGGRFNEHGLGYGIYYNAHSSPVGIAPVLR